jgi:threonine 3-dehydrogenase
MYALVKKEASPGLWLEQVPEPAPGPGEVKVKIRKTAVCGTDLHIYNWDAWSQANIKPPLVIGHEFVGEIAETGAGVGNCAVGELVSGEGHIICGKCRNCLAGRGHLCMAEKGVGVHRDGAFAEYLVIPAVNVRKCVPGIDEEIYAFFDPLGNAVHSALSFDLVGEDVLITGAGPIGIMAAAVCRFSGARHVVITDVNGYRLDLAKKLGIQHTVNVARQDLKTEMDRIGLREGFDIGLEMSGNARALAQMIGNMRRGGQIALLGILGDDTRIDWSKVIFNGLMLKGIYGREMHETWYKMTSLLQSGLSVAPVVTHRFGARDFAQGFEIMNTGLCGKVILDWTEVSP